MTFNSGLCAYNWCGLLISVWQQIGMIHLTSHRLFVLAGRETADDQRERFASTRSVSCFLFFVKFLVHFRSLFAALTPLFGWQEAHPVYPVYIRLLKNQLLGTWPDVDIDVVEMPTVADESWCLLIFTSTKEVMFLPDFVFCLSVCKQDNSKSYGRIFQKFLRYVENGTSYQWCNFGGDLEGILDSGSLWNFRYHCFQWGIRETAAKPKMVLSPSEQHCLGACAGSDCFLVLLFFAIIFSPFILCLIIVCVCSCFVWFKDVLVCCSNRSSLSTASSHSSCTL